MSTSLDRAGAHGSTVQGLVDAVTPSRIHGWVWDASVPDTRLHVRLLRDGEPVAETVADVLRPDLAPNGIGDGRHAFEFAVDPEWTRTGGKFTVEVRRADGSFGSLPRADRGRRDSDPLALVADRLASVVSEQQRIRLELVRRDARPAAEGEQGTAQDAALEGLTDRLLSLEVWLSRLDERLARLPEQPPAADGGTGMGRLLAAALLSALVVGSLAAAFLMMP